MSANDSHECSQSSLRILQALSDQFNCDVKKAVPDGIHSSEDSKIETENKFILATTSQYWCVRF